MGAVARVWVDSLIPGPTMAVLRFPWATFSVNLLGAFILGLVLGLYELHGNRPMWLRALLGIGFCGSFTTFSSATVEFIILDRLKDPLMAYSYAILSLALGVLLAWLGSRLAVVMAPKTPVEGGA